MTLFMEGSHVSPSPWLVTGKDGTTIGTCGLSFRGWSERLARVGLWLRTFLASFPLPPMTSARIWSVSGTASGFGILKLWLSAPRTRGHGCSLWRTWATPKAGDAIIGATARTSGRPLKKTTHLAAQVHLYPTPRAADGIAGVLRKPENIRDTSRLEDFVAILPPPTANDAKCNGPEEQELDGAERRGGGQSEPGVGGGFDGFSPWLDGDWERGIPRVARGVPDRVARLKALGNAVVPQQAYPIFRAIAEIEKETTE